MQTRELNQLYSALTSIHPNFRYAALSRIADPQQTIVHGRWTDDQGHGCLFVVAAEATLRRKLRKGEFSQEPIAKFLGIGEHLVFFGIQAWDSATAEERQQIRKAMRTYLDKHYPVQKFATTPAARQPEAVCA